MAYYNSDAPARAARLFKIVNIVASRKPGESMGRENLAEACSCSIKTIQRDVLCLQEAGIPLEYDLYLKSYTLPQTGWIYPLVQMSPTDAMALAFARSLLLNTSSALPFTAEMSEALDKVTTALTPPLRSLFDSAARSFADRGGTARDYSHAPVGALLDAINRRETVEMEYESRSSHTFERRRIDPYRLDRREGRYFELQAWCHRRQQVRTFALDRIHNMTMTGLTFVLQPWDEELEEVVGGIRSGARVRVEVRFAPIVALYAKERRWGFPATFEDQEDGAVILRGTVRGTEGMVRELMTWQRYAEALGGSELRAAMAAEVKAMALLYAA